MARSVALSMRSGWAGDGQDRASPATIRATERGAPQNASRVAHGATACLRSDLARARVLADSFLAFHPGGSFTILVVDGPRHAGAAGAGGSEPGLAIWAPGMLATGSRPIESILPSEEPEVARRAAGPWLASTLFDLGRSPLVLLHASTLVLGSLEPLTDAAARSGAAFVPRLIDSSVAHHSAHATEDVLAAGIVDQGIVALVDGIGSRAWLAWWKSLDHEVPGGQRAFDLGPGFGHALVRDPGIGLSRWNLHERRVVDSPDGPTAGGSPLRTISFEGLLSTTELLWTDDRSAPTPPYEPGEPLYELASEYLARVAALAE